MLFNKVGFLTSLVTLHYLVLDAFFTGSLVATLSSIQEKILSQQLQDVNHVNLPGAHDPGRDQ